jgi:hypothetical protein
MKKENNKELSRRNFLTGTVALFLTALLGGCNAKTLTSTITTTETNILTNTITNILTTTETTTTTAMITETVTEVINYEATVNGIDNVVVHNDFSHDVFFEELDEMYQGQVGYGSNIIKYDEIDLTYEQRTSGREIHIEEGEPFKAFFVILYGIQTPQPLLVTAILDYQQIEFTLDGKYGLLHEVVVPSESEGICMTFPVQIDIKGKGAHDLQLIFFDDPYNLTLDWDYRSDLHGRTEGIRGVVIVGEDETPAMSLSANTDPKTIAEDATFRPYTGFAYVPPDDNHPSNRQLYVDEAKAGELYKFQIYACNKNSEDSMREAVMLFHNYHKVDINDLDMLIMDFHPYEEVILNVEMLLEEPALHYLQMVYLFDPCKPILNDEMEFNEEIFLPLVLGSPRIAILAKQNG